LVWETQVVRSAALVMATLAAAREATAVVRMVAETEATTAEGMVMVEEATAMAAMEMVAVAMGTANMVVEPVVVEGMVVVWEGAVDVVTVRAARADGGETAATATVVERAVASMPACSNQARRLLR